MSPLYHVKCRIHTSDGTCISSVKKVDGSYIDSYFITWKLKSQISNITAIVKTNHLLRWLCASRYFYNQYCPLHCTGIQPIMKLLKVGLDACIRVSYQTCHTFWLPLTCILDNFVRSQGSGHYFVDEEINAISCSDSIQLQLQLKMIFLHFTRYSGNIFQVWWTGQKRLYRISLGFHGLKIIQISLFLTELFKK